MSNMSKSDWCWNIMLMILTHTFFFSLAVSQATDQGKREAVGEADWQAEPQQPHHSL